jgi:hypothetical protein
VARSIWKVAAGICCVGGSSASIAAAPNDNHTPESIGAQPASGYEPWRKFAHSSQLFQAGTPVGYLETELADGRRIECSGMAVAANLVLTARHCIRLTANKPPKVIRFWLGDTHTDGGIPFILDPTPKDVIDGDDQETDFAVMTSKAQFDLTQIRIPPLGADPSPMQPLYIYHEPFGQPLTLTRFQCWVIEEPRPTDGMLHHTCDTQTGSSGAPIMNESFQIVGLHVLGGKTETEGTFNEGLPISRIVARSAVLKNALTHGVGQVAHVPESNLTAQPSTVFKLSNGDVFRNSAGQWVLEHFEGTTTTQTALKQQGEPDGNYLLWEPNADLLYEIPVSGGAARKRPAQNGNWDALGWISKQ